MIYPIGVTTYTDLPEGIGVAREEGRSWSGRSFRMGWGWGVSPVASPNGTTLGSVVHTVHLPLRFYEAI